MAQADTDRIYDEYLVTLVRAGDSRAAERLAVRWYPRLLRTARRILRDADQAQDAVQEAWAAICWGWPRLSDTAKFPAWAFGILHRKCVDRIRREQKRRARHGALDTAQEPASPTRSEMQYALDQAFERLSADHRIAAILYFSEGLTLSEVAAATDVPVGTAKSRIFHARKHLKSTLEGDV